MWWFMKKIFIAILVLLSTNLFASKFSPADSFSRESLNIATSNLSSMEFINRKLYKKVIELKAAGKTEQAIRQNTVAQAIHLSCSFFDDGVEISLASKNMRSLKRTLAEFQYYIDESLKNTFLETIYKINNEADIEVYAGAASGNNTSGAVLGIYDIKNNEVAVFASTNCGSDD